MDRPQHVRRAGALVGTSYFILGLIDPNLGILQLPLQWLLKEELHLGAEEMAAFFAIAFIPWYLKPIAGCVCDNLSVFGSRRRFYFISGAVMAAAGSLALSLVPHGPTYLLPVIILVHTALVIVNTTTGGALVEQGQRYYITGRLSSIRSLAESFAGLIVGPVGGWLAGVGLGAPSWVCAILAATMAGIFALTVEDPPDAATPGSARDHLCFTLELLADRSVWVAAGLMCFYQIAPGFYTPLFYLQTNVLHFAPHFIGSLALVFAIGSIVGSLVYAYASRKVAFARLFPLAIVIGCSMNICYVGYDSARNAILIEFGNGLCSALTFIAMLHLIARSIPRKHEALGYALVFSLANLTHSVSDILGSYLYSSGVKFASLVWLNAGTTALIALVAPFLPRRIREGAEEAPAKYGLSEAGAREA